ncbi:MAG: hypothetical protein WEB58_02345 [Planctomycetaceae bacterium]
MMASPKGAGDGNVALVTFGYHTVASGGNRICDEKISAAVFG